jgi:hypothetical protein
MQKLSENPELTQFETELRKAAFAADNTESSPDANPADNRKPATAEATETPKGSEAPSEVKTEEAPKDVTKQPETDRAEASAEKTEKTETPEESKYSKAKKDAERKDRSWKALNEEKEKLAAEREAIRLEKERIAAEKSATAKPSTPAADPKISKWTPEQLEESAEEFEAEGKWETAKQARLEAQRIRGEIATRTFWQNADKVVEQIPELKDANTPLGKEVKRLIHTFPAFMSIPDGFARAVEVAQAMQGSAEASALRTQVSELKQEIERLKKATAISGSPPSERSAPKKFEELSMEEQAAALRSLAKEEDAQTVLV